MNLREITKVCPINRTQKRLEISGRMARASWNGKAFVEVLASELVMYCDTFTYQVPTPYTLTFEDLMAEDWLFV
jgi:hypothetical protein